MKELIDFNQFRESNPSEKFSGFGPNSQEVRWEMVPTNGEVQLIYNVFTGNSFPKKLVNFFREHFEEPLFLINIERWNKNPLSRYDEHIERTELAKMFATTISGIRFPGQNDLQSEYQHILGKSADIVGRAKLEKQGLDLIQYFNE